MRKADQDLKPMTHGALQQCFGCGQANRTGLRLRFYMDTEGQVVAPLRVAKRFQGPPGHAHGGVIATLLDEAMSKANRARNVVAMTRTLEVEYLRPVPVETPLRLTARHLSADGRKHHCEAELINGEGVVLARGRALFIALHPEKFQKSQIGK